MRKQKFCKKIEPSKKKYNASLLCHVLEVNTTERKIFAFYFHKKGSFSILRNLRNNYKEINLFLMSTPNLMQLLLRAVKTLYKSLPLQPQ